MISYCFVLSIAPPLDSSESKGKVELSGAYSKREHTDNGENEPDTCSDHDPIPDLHRGESAVHNITDQEEQDIVPESKGSNSLGGRVDQDKTALESSEAPPKNDPEQLVANSDAAKSNGEYVNIGGSGGDMAAFGGYVDDDRR